MKTKPFNKERAIAGDPVVDKTGQRWEFVMDIKISHWPLVFKMENDDLRLTFKNDGKFWDDMGSYRDLSMLDTTP